ncbi:MAG: asparagine synthase (glutamine-hydrolyzing) [Coriobacteriia bacterium]|nr:asparagine synthase (glutamine-hydrolyzing) [Coriobacteriia bacterium]
MSGFCGFTGKTNNSADVLSVMMDKVKHRGPDYTRNYLGKDASVGFCGLGVGYGKAICQNIHSEDTEVVTVFDGDIENYTELRKDLEAQGHSFIDDSEVHLISVLYREYGRDLLSHLQGSFAFVVVDQQEKLVFAARDRFGVKPLYYSVHQGELVFASEIKSLLAFPEVKPTLNKPALEQYLSFQYSVLEETFFSGIYRLMPAQSLIFQDSKVETESYYFFEFTPEQQDFNTAVSQIEDAVLGAVEPYKESELEVGSFLSAGVDSSFIAATAKPKACFTVGYDDYNDKDYSEIKYAKEFVEEFGMHHEVKYISPEEYFNALPKALYSMDEPLADPAAIAFYLGCEAAAQHVKMAFSGEGPDEFFGGYGIYSEPFALAKLNFVPKIIRKALSKALSQLPFSIKGKNYLIRAGKPVEERFIGNAHIFSKDERKKVLKFSTDASPLDLTQPYYDKAGTLDDSTKMQYIDVHFWLHGDILHQADRMSMANSLLIKTPYLNQGLVNIAAKLPTKYRVTPAKDKVAFRAAAMRHLPKSFAQREKKAFPVPLKNWLAKEEYRSYVEGYFRSEAARKFFDEKELNRLLQQHREGKIDNSRKIWTILNFLVWYEQYFEAS